MAERQFFSVFALIMVTTLLLGVVYPLGFTWLANTFFPREAQGSLIRDGERVIGSSLIAQGFSRPEYFHPRPSLAGDGYDAANSGASNLGQTSSELIGAIGERVEAVRASSGDGPVPVELVTASGGGLDPHISPAAAARQLARVAAARQLPEAQVRELVASHTEGRSFGVLGEPRVNVLELNLALDDLSSSAR